MNAPWALAWLLAALAVVWLTRRGILALAPGGSGAVFPFLCAAAITLLMAWAYRHRAEAKVPQKARRR